jgi:hypothetical protein
MTNLSFEHYFRPSDRELSRAAALRYARGGALTHSRYGPRRAWRTRLFSRRPATTHPAVPARPATVEVS